MTDSEILAQVKTGLDLFLDKTYEVKNLYNHILQIIRDNSEPAMLHKKQLERLIFKTQEMRENQRAFHAGNKNRLSTCRIQEGDMDKLINYLLTTGYSTEKFKPKVTQAKLL